MLQTNASAIPLGGWEGSAGHRWKQGTGLSSRVQIRVRMGPLISRFLCLTIVPKLSVFRKILRACLENVISTFLAWFSLKKGSWNHTGCQHHAQVSLKSAKWFQPNWRGLIPLTVALHFCTFWKQVREQSPSGQHLQRGRTQLLCILLGSMNRHTCVCTHIDTPHV